MSVHRACVMVALTLALAAPQRAAAQEPAESQEAAALALGEEGLQRFQAARWQEAYELFRQANDVSHAPTLVLYMAHCQARRKELPAAYRLYREVAREQLAEDAPVQFRTAQAVAHQELHWIEPRIGVVRAVVTGAPEEQVRVLVDGAEVPGAQLDELAVEPGEHVIEASIPGGASVRRTVTVLAGGFAAVVLCFGALARVELEAPVAAALLHPSPSPPRLLLPAGVALGLGVTGLVAGTVTGAISLRTAAAVKSRCDAVGHCLAADQASAASAQRLADASTGSLVVGGVAAATGVLLGVLHLRQSKTLAEPAVRVGVGPGSAAIFGVF